MNKDFQRTLDLWDSSPRYLVTHEVTSEDILKSFDHLVKKAITLGGQEITATRTLAYKHKDNLPQLPSIWRRIIRGYRKDQMEKREITDPRGLAEDRAFAQEGWDRYGR